jgi:hypothetical protein
LDDGGFLCDCWFHNVATITALGKNATTPMNPARPGLTDRSFSPCIFRPLPPPAKLVSDMIPRNHCHYKILCAFVIQESAPICVHPQMKIRAE